MKHRVRHATLVCDRKRRGNASSIHGVKVMLTARQLAITIMAPEPMEVMKDTGKNSSAT